MRVWRFFELLHKSRLALQSGGIKLFWKKVKGYFRKVKMGRQLDSRCEADAVCADVLFINGCYLPHPHRYRVAHQREQLLCANMCSAEISYEKLSLGLVKQYRLFVFFRCPYTEMVGQFIAKAKELGKPVLYDVDDLVIDTKYTDEIPYLQNMGSADKQLYDEGVQRMQKTLCLCDAAITTTERLADELRHYVPEVFINRNVASIRMLQLSQFAAAGKKPHGEIVRIGYFSGSITHNADIAMILPSLEEVLRQCPQTELWFVGELEIPEALQPYQDRIKAQPFLPWEQLPELIANVDINIAPLEDRIFNEAKSENKWTEAALVKVPTIASNLGAMRSAIRDQETGILCDNTKESWTRAIMRLVCDPGLRQSIAENAYEEARKHYVTLYSEQGLYNYVRSKMRPNVVFVFPSLMKSGGLLVALKHCQFLWESGYDVLIRNEGLEQEDVEFEGKTFPVLPSQTLTWCMSIEKAVATLWSTLDFLIEYRRIHHSYYLVQGYETDFTEPGNFLQVQANQSYRATIPVQYLTVSRWCCGWLSDHFDQQGVRFAPNGLETRLFYPAQRDFSQKVRILVEGDCGSYYKNVDESFYIVKSLDPERYEIWYLSYNAAPKSWYRIDRVFRKIPHEEVPEIYRSCHILLKSSLLESFSYPPLEMMATGGFVVACLNEGNQEYLMDGVNCLLYPRGDTDAAVDCIERICQDDRLRGTLYEGGQRAAQERDWGSIRTQVLDLYREPQELLPDEGEEAKTE